MTVETGRGVLTLALDVVGGKVGTVTVDMGKPTLELAEVPVDREKVVAAGEHRYRLTLPKTGQVFEAVFVSMGNPHATVFVDDVDAIDLPAVGPLIENHPAFPRRINAHFVQMISRSELKMRTWERGTGITMACGTGACAVAVSAVLTGRSGRGVLAHLPGGDLKLHWREADGHVHMTGTATEVFSGDWTGGG